MPRDYGNVLWVLDQIHDGDWPGSEPPASTEVLGHDGAAWIVVREDGEVWAVHPQTSTYVNASRPLFEETCRRFESRWDEVDRRSLRDGAVADELAAQLRGLVMEVDSSISEDRFSWWLGVIDVAVL